MEGIHAEYWQHVIVKEDYEYEWSYAYPKI